MNFFNPPKKNEDQKYKNIRDSNAERTQKIKDLIGNKLWPKYEVYADPNFRDEIQINGNFNSRFWEMYLAYTLMQAGLTLKEKNDSKGPDICIDNKGQNVWIECTAPTGGEKGKPDSLPVTNLNGSEVFNSSSSFEDDTNKIILRYTNAIKEKHDSYQDSIEKEIISDYEPYIIAISASNLPLFANYTEDELPNIIKALYGLGCLQIHFDNKTLRQTGSSHQIKIERMKNNKSRVKTDFFLTKDFSGISAILFSYPDIGNLPTEFGLDFLIVHNPYAKNKLPFCFINLGTEYIPQIDVHEITLTITKH